MLESMIVIWFDGYFFSTHPDVKQYVEEIRRTVSIRSVAIQISGKRHSFLHKDLQEYDDPERGRVYVLSPGKLK